MEQDFDYHYHEFDKVVVFLSGSVTYVMEGTAYYLEPWDVLIVGHDQVHSTIIDGADTYERIVLWMRPGFLEENSTPGFALGRFITLAREREFALVRPDADQRAALMRLLNDVEDAAASRELGHELMARTALLQFLVLLNRAAADMRDACGAYRRDEKFNDILAYINRNLAADLSIAALSARFYISPSRLAHKFKDMTGCTPHSYITAKRLLAAADMIKRGEPASIAASSCGYSDYSSFLRAFTKLFNCTPRLLSLSRERESKQRESAMGGIGSELGPGH